MDIISLPVSKRLASSSRGVSGQDDVDRISMLPDEVLGIILSFLTTKEAVAASILSKRWNNVWTLTPDLDIGDQPWYLYKKYGFGCVNKFRYFEDFVDLVLSYHRQSVIRKCCLSCFSKFTSPNIYRWVCTVIARKVQELTIKCSSFNVNQLPQSVFTCKTLVVLKIYGKFVLDLPTHIHFPCLKILSLKYVVFIDGVDASVERLISCCPVLEDLTICRQALDTADSEVMRISSLSLKRLDCFTDGLYKTEIQSASLEYLKLEGSSLFTLNLKLPSLIEAHIQCRCNFSLMYGISKVKHLVLFSDAVSSLHFFTRGYALHTLNNLIKVELYIHEKKVDWELLPRLLESSPNLEVLVFPKGLVVPKKVGRSFHRFYWDRPKSVPECLLLHLKTVEINNFVGMPGEVCFVEYLLECAEVLETMTIQRYDLGRRRRLKRKLEEHVDYLLKCLRASSTCELIFSD